ncbi:hypothetical protein [Streptomyces sp.]|uniref:hypothetical protein n=1 Tax=Streptomyces sp. TaxID=1931 RepID=UPI002810BEE1|nr:hypothetical protein [Streptomyces sp.]
MDATPTALAGTPSGVIATHGFQGRAAERTAAPARSEPLRQGRIARGAFAGTPVEHRHSRKDRWLRAVEEPGPEEAEETRFVPHRRRTAARQALFRVRLVCDDPEVRRLTEAARAHEAADEEDARRSDRARQARARFVTAAAAPGVR